MTVPLDGRGFWPSTFASIPANWSQDTDFSLKFIQSADASENPGATAGGTHNHTDTHVHTIPTHGHTLTITGNASGSTLTDNVSKGAAVRGASHNHSSGTSVFRAMTMSSTESTSSSTVAQPLSRDVIFIKPDDGNQDYPDDAIALTEETTAPFGYSLADGTGGTVDFEDHFIYCVDTGSDGGGTRGSSTHDHTLSHGHSIPKHTHPNSDFGGDLSLVLPSTEARKGATVSVTSSHHEAQGMNQVTATVNTTSPTITASSSEPSFKKLMAIQNTSGAASTPIGLIIAYVGDILDVPIQDGWVYMDGTRGTEDMRTYQIKCTVTSGEIGDTGGSNAHTHPVASHLHTGIAHVHTYSFVNTPISVASTSGFTTFHSTHTHTHTSNSMANASVNTNNQSSTTDSSDVRDAYRKVIFIKFKGLPTVYIQGATIQGATIL